MILARRGVQSGVISPTIQGSIDGTRAGMGMYIINRVMMGDFNFNMSEFYTGVHAYWELGFIGVFLLSALSGILIAISIVYFESFGLAGPFLMIIMFKPPWLEVKLWTSEMIADLFHTMIPLIILWYLIRFIIDSIGKAQKKSVKKSNN